MRHVAAVAFLAACTSPATGPAGPKGDKGEPGAGADPSLLMSLMQRVANLEERKSPHLILAETGADLGPFLDWEHAWSSEIGSYYQIANRALVLYSEDDCKGLAAANSAGNDRFVVGSTLTILELMEPADFAARSAFSDSGRCTSPYGGTFRASPFRDTGISARSYRREALRAELR